MTITEAMRTKALILSPEDIFGLSMYKRKCIYIIIMYILIIVTFDRKIIKDNLPCKLLSASVWFEKSIL